MLTDLGGSPKHVNYLSVSISVLVYYCLVLRIVVVIAASKHPDLDNVKFLQTADECTEIAFHFGALSIGYAINTCILMIDGSLLWI